jgi:small subunit ribosomal protein S6
MVSKEDKTLCDYELVVIISPEVGDEAIDNVIGRISRFITENGGTVSTIDRWGRKRLAYPIKHFMEGSYVLAQFKLGPKLGRELEASLEISEEILRHLLIRLTG